MWALAEAALRKESWDKESEHIYLLNLLFMVVLEPAFKRAQWELVGHGHRETDQSLDEHWLLLPPYENSLRAV